MPEGMRCQCDKWQIQIIRTNEIIHAFCTLVQECFVLSYHGELLPCMRQEVGPLGFCFLLIRVPADCLCPHTNRISHASFPMVFSPVLASWWMENRTEERVCDDVCLASVRQQSQLQPQSSICPGHQIHHLGCGQAEKRSIHNLGTSETVKLKYSSCSSFCVFVWQPAFLCLCFADSQIQKHDKHLQKTFGKRIYSIHEHIVIAYYTVIIPRSDIRIYIAVNA